MVFLAASWENASNHSSETGEKEMEMTTDVELWSRPAQSTPNFPTETSPNSPDITSGWPATLASGSMYCLPYPVGIPSLDPKRATKKVAPGAMVSTRRTSTSAHNLQKIVANLMIGSPLIIQSRWPKCVSLERLLNVRKDGDSDSRRKTHATTERTAGQSRRTVHLSAGN